MPTAWRSRLGYRALLGFRPGFLVVLRGFDARAAFRGGFLAAAFAVFLVAGFFEAFRALEVTAFAFVDRFLVVELFFFGAVFAFRVVRFLAAPIAAPESAPITVPTTGTPSAVPATAPATAPPRVLPAVPVPVSVPVSVSPLSLSSMFLSRVERMTLALVSRGVNSRPTFCTAAERLGGLTSMSRRTITLWRGLIHKARRQGKGAGTRA
jgi:hypothetical protein